MKTEVETLLIESVFLPLEMNPSSFCDQVFSIAESNRFPRAAAAKALGISLPLFDAAKRKVWGTRATKNKYSAIELCLLWISRVTPFDLHQKVTQLFEHFKITVSCEGISEKLVTTYATEVVSVFNPARLPRKAAANRIGISLPTFDRLRFEGKVTEYFLVGQKQGKWSHPRFHPLEIDQIIRDRNRAHQLSRVWESV